VQQVVAVIGQRYAYQAEPPLILDDYSTCKYERSKTGLSNTIGSIHMKPIRKGTVVHEKILEFHH
jgi:hypothetical protein